MERLGDVEANRSATTESHGAHKPMLRFAALTAPVERVTQPHGCAVPVPTIRCAMTASAATACRVQ